MAVYGVAKFKNIIGAPVEIMIILLIYIKNLQSFNESSYGHHLFFSNKSVDLTEALEI